MTCTDALASHPISLPSRATGDRSLSLSKMRAEAGNFAAPALGLWRPGRADPTPSEDGRDEHQPQHERPVSSRRCGAYGGATPRVVGSTARSRHPHVGRAAGIEPGDIFAASVVARLDGVFGALSAETAPAVVAVGIDETLLLGLQTLADTGPDDAASPSRTIGLGRRTGRRSAAAL